VNRSERYHVLTLFLVAVVLLASDLSALSFPASLFAGLAYVLAWAILVVAPAYLLADVAVALTDG
jgi:hypothetical protein